MRTSGKTPHRWSKGDFHRSTKKIPSLKPTRHLKIGPPKRKRSYSKHQHPFSGANLVLGRVSVFLSSQFKKNMIFYLRTEEILCPKKASDFPQLFSGGGGEWGKDNTSELPKMWGFQIISKNRSNLFCEFKVFGCENLAFV